MLRPYHRFVAVADISLTLPQIERAMRDQADAQKVYQLGVIAILARAGDDVVEFDIGFDRILKTERGLTEDLDLLAHIHHIDLGAPFGGQCRHLGFDADPHLERSEESRGGKGVVSTVSLRGSPAP